MNNILNFELSKILTPRFYLVFAIITIICIILNVEIMVNDDTYVYFNYAKNFVNGNYFAYDSRKIPSEGFTSLIYLLLLIPFEYIKFPLPVAGFFINSTALILSGFFLLKAINLNTSKKSNGVLAAILFVSFCFIDKNITGIIGWTFETLLNLLCFLILIYGCVRIKTSQKGTLLLFIIYFISILIRPENIVIFSPFLLYVLLIFADKIKYIRHFIYFLSVFIAYLLVKYLIFGDIFPTGFYRKMSSPGLFNKDGILYVKDFLLEYKFHIIFIIVATIGFKILKKDEKFIDKNIIISSVIICFVTILFFLKSNPLIGVHFRYLINIMGMIYILMSFIIIQIFSNKRGVLLAGIAILQIGKTSANVRNNIFSFIPDTETQINQHKYIQLGKYFNENIKNPGDIYFAFGDAGAIPYSFSCKFIDLNGLSEPYLAKLVSNKNSSLKTELYIRYLNKYKPDIIVILNGEENQKNPVLLHGPLQKPNEYRSFLKNLSENGYLYGGTIKAYYKLHIALNKNSKNFEELSNVLKKYSQYENISDHNGRFIINFDIGNIQFNSINTNLK
ncbi:hypothetical protein [Chryseobacterium carnipullorum]|uniref:hypothetical protein n=1 Tax=Chryseobacterium carnipullorum TaxID=1124835 RepID=UPI0023F4BB59|nr:hypothetical protein [Chryseobacterium carnipullorum]